MDSRGRQMDRKVIFWGCGNIAGQMYRNYKSEFTLLYGISNNPNETAFIPQEGHIFPVKRPENKKGKAKGMIVICCAEYEKVAEQLSLSGYIPFVDFIDYELAETIWTGKKIVLLYGFCHLRGVAECLRGTKEFSKIYMPVYYPNYLFLNFYQQGRLQYLLSHCSALVYARTLDQENYRKNTAILGNLKRSVRVYALHAVYFGGYFPQKKRTYNKMNEFAAKSEGYDYTPFSYGDSWLNECIEQEMGFDDIFEYIEKKEVYEKDFIQRYAEGEWKRLRYQEQETDLRIADYIEKYYRTQRLFRNEAHMENIVLYEYARQVLQYLGCSGRIQETDAPFMKCSQHFIYPCVAKALELGWDVWQEELDLYTYDGWKKVNMKEYIQAYYESCREIRQLKRKYMLP